MRDWEEHDYRIRRRDPGPLRRMTMREHLASLIGGVARLLADAAQALTVLAIWIHEWRKDRVKR